MEHVYRPRDIYGEAKKDLIEFNRRLLSIPDKGSAGKTGTWRLYKPVIDYGKCTRCGFCWLYCPDDVITWRQREYPVIDYTYCKGCGVCRSVCPVDAIMMVLEGE